MGFVMLGLAVGCVGRVLNLHLHLLEYLFCENVSVQRVGLTF